MVDDVDNCNRAHEMDYILPSTNSRDNDDIEGLGYRWGSDDNYFKHDDLPVTGKPSQASHAARVKPSLSPFTHGIFYPATCRPSTLDCEIVSDAADATVTPTANDVFTPSNTTV